MRDYKVKFGNRVARFSMEMRNTDAPVGTEELAHMEIVSAIIHQLTKDLTPEEIAASGFDKYYVDHTLGLWPQA
ncbi:MAG: manganese catalase family protein, partial [Lachnospiraceae bacterium]|nr:manganese catalase family protein [Lachnospiraceae bacterium]